MMHVRRAVACVGTLAVTLCSVAHSANAVDPASKTSADAALSWLKAQQQTDGGFELAQFPGFETLDATMAIAEAAQTGGTWSASEAKNSIEALRFGGSGPTPFDAIDAYAETIPNLGILTAGTAAKNIVLGAIPYGFDPAAFDPAGDGTPIDLVSLMGGCSASGDPIFNLALYTILAQSLVCNTPPATALQAVRDAQQANGGWNYLADPTGTDIDPDTTSLAVEALVAGGADASDPVVKNALASFTANQQASGAWQSFGSDDPNSTSLAILGITAAGYDVESPCWRDTADPTKAGSAYVSPTAWIRSQQQPDGRIASPNDGFGINTFTTSQSVQGLLQSWLPVTRAATQTCQLAPTPTVDTTTPAAGSAVTISGGGFAASTALTIELHSTPVVLDTTTSDAFGNYRATVMIPADTQIGAHELVVSGLDPDGELRSVSVAITVVASTAPAPTPLPSPTPTPLPTSTPTAIPTVAATAAAVPTSAAPRFTG